MRLATAIKVAIEALGEKGDRMEELVADGDTSLHDELARNDGAIAALRELRGLLL